MNSNILQFTRNQLEEEVGVGYIFLPTSRGPLPPLRMNGHTLALQKSMRSPYKSKSSQKSSNKTPTPNPYISNSLHHITPNYQIRARLGSCFHPNLSNCLRVSTSKHNYLDMVPPRGDFSSPKLG